MAAAPAMTAAAQAGAHLQRAAFSDLPGWAEDDHLAALETFARSCAGPLRVHAQAQTDLAEETRAAPRPRRAKALVPACDALLKTGGSTGFSTAAARAFFEAWFTPARVVLPEGGRGHVTAYYEPVLEAAAAPDPRFPVPLFAPPADLVAVTAANRPSGFPAGLTAGRRTGQGIEPFPDRRALSDPSAWKGLEPLAWLADPVDAYFVHIQGSVRLHLKGGGTMRLGFAGKNGHPYRSAGKAMIERGLVPAAGMTSEAMKTWLKANAAQAADILAVNPSYVFFRRIEGLDEALGPVGAEGVALTAGRSMAIDPDHIGYGMPVYVSADLPTGRNMKMQPFRRLMIAQDTGSAIRGPARGDLFWGTGAEAGEVAGRVNNAADFFVLVPRAEAAK